MQQQKKKRSNNMTTWTYAAKNDCKIKTGKKNIHFIKFSCSMNIRLNINVRNDIVCNQKPSNKIYDYSIKMV